MGGAVEAGEGVVSVYEADYECCGGVSVEGIWEGGVSMWARDRGGCWVWCIRGALGCLNETRDLRGGLSASKPTWRGNEL